MHKLPMLYLPICAAMAALLAVVVNGVLLMAAERIVLCPERCIAYIADVPYCTSYRWSASRLLLVQALALALVYWATRKRRRLTLWVAQIPVGLFLIVFSSLSHQAADQVAPESAEKVEAEGPYDVPVGWTIALLAVGVVELTLMRRSLPWLQARRR